MGGCWVFAGVLLSFEFFLRCNPLILSERVRECVRDIPLSALWMVVIGGLFAEMFRGFVFRLEVRRRLVMLRSGLCEGVNVIPQPGAAIVGGAVDGSD